MFCRSGTGIRTAQNRVVEVHLLASEADYEDSDERIVTGSRDDAIEQMFPTRQQTARTNECLLIKISIFNFDLNVTLVTASNFHLEVGDTCRGFN